jgi:hypothetical protein
VQENQQPGKAKSKKKVIYPSHDSKTMQVLAQETSTVSGTIGGLVALVRSLNPNKELTVDDLPTNAGSRVLLFPSKNGKVNHNKNKKFSEETSTDYSIAKKQKLPELTPDIAFFKKLHEIKESYTKAINYYKQRDYDKTEAEIVKILKPVLSNQGPDVLPSSYIKQVATIVLDSLYHLGSIYLNSNKYNENYAKAAAIFQYCQKFYIEYKPEFKINNSNIDSTHFESMAFSTETLFVLSHSSNSVSYTLQEVGMLPALYFIKNYKQPLEEFRSGIGLELEKIKEYSIKDVCTRVKAVKNLYSKCSNFFINKHSTGFVQRIMQDCFNQLGCELESDEYTIISLGSFASGTMTPWSDLEFAILVRFSNSKEYFREFTRLLQIKIINLGETILPIVGVETLNNVRTANEEDDWFWDEMTQQGFCLDGKRWYACKSALGRQEGYKILKKLNGETILIDIPDYELILTPEEMAEFQSEPQMGTNWFKTDKYLVQALRFTSLIMGSQELYNDYKQKLQHKISTKILQSRTLELLQEDVSKYYLKLDETQYGQLLNVKEFYRIIDRVISALGNYFEINTIQGDTGFTSWQILEQIKLKGEISKTGKQHLDEALTITTELRLHAYHHNFAQKEWISACSLIKGGFKNVNDSLETSSIFHFMDTPILHHFYYIILRLQYILQNYPGHEAIAILKTDSIFEDCDFNKGKVHMRFLEYNQATLYLERAHIHEPENLPILLDLFFLYTKMSDNYMAREVEKKISKLQKELLSPNINITDDPPLKEGNASFLHSINEEISFINDEPTKVLGLDFDSYSFPLDAYSAP